jgi:ATP-binding cassette, subfamily F, member 3
MVELAADRLVLVDGGTAKPYDGNMEDYIDFILGRNQSKSDKPGAGKDGKDKGSAQDRKARAAAREDYRALKKKQSQAENAVARLQAELAHIDRAMFEPAKALPEHAKLTMSDLSQRRATLAKELAQAEESWLLAGEALEGAE